MMNIIHKRLKEFPGHHVSSEGFVTKIGSSGPNWKYLGPRADKDGYLRVDLRLKDEVKTKRVHRLVLETFIGPCPEGMECCHLDGNPRNNRTRNLKWATHKENESHKINNGVCKLSKPEVKVIKSLLQKGRSLSSIARQFNVTKTNIWCIKEGRTWSHVAPHGDAPR